MIVHQPAAAVCREEQVDALRRRIARLERFPRPAAQARDTRVSPGEGISLACAAGWCDVVSTGAPPLDALLPRGGLRQGSLTEWLSGGLSSGAQSLALLAAREACQAGRSLVVVDRARRFYPPAAAAWGIDLARLIVVHPASEADELWAIDQALRCRGIGAVWAWRGDLDPRDFRRLALAAESGGTLGLLIRPAQVRGQPSWADVQLVVSSQSSPLAGRAERQAGSLPHGWRLLVEVTRCRGSHPGRSVELEIEEWTGRIQTSSVSEGASHETHLVHPAAELAPPAAGRGPARFLAS